MPEQPMRDANVTARCRVCSTPMPAGQPRQFCSGRCRQAAYRHRHNPPAPALPPLPAGAGRRPSGVYECAGCGQRLAGERRCPDCNLFARRIGDGGECPNCSEIITIEEVLNLQ
ncbi:MAG: hypothetical protein ACYDAQ_07600 [Mycobacteriales bacterium]